MKRTKILDFLKNKTFENKSRYYRLIAVLIISSFLLTFLLYNGVEFARNKFKSGEIARKTIIAKKSFRYVNAKATNNLLKDKIADTPVVYIYYPETKTTLKKRIRNAFQKARGYEKGRSENRNNIQTAGKIFSSELGVKLKEATLNELYFLNYNKNIEKYILTIVDYIYKKGVLSKTSPGNKAIELKNIITNSSKIVRYPPFFFTLGQANNFIYYYIRKYLGFLTSYMQNDIYRITSGIIKPDIVYSKPLTLRKIEAVKKVTSPIYIHIVKGMMLIHAGQLITKSKALELNTYENKFILKNNIPLLFGLFLIVAMILSLSYLFPYKYIRKFRTSVDFKNIIFIITILILSILAIKAGIVFANALAGYFPFINPQDLYYLIPFAFGAMIVRIILNSEVSVVYIALFSIMTAIIFKNNVFFMAYAFGGSFIASYEVFDFSSWGRLIRAGVITGAVNGFMVMAFSLVGPNILGVQNLYSLFFAVLSGIISSVIVIGLIPVLEHIFKYTTDFKLLELSSSNHPLLKQLSVIAPGTYQHSIMVATLAESAASAINANPLLARVASLYHDVGKTIKPNYFIENIAAQENPHNKLSPTMSSLIIASHVKDGSELAKKYGLGEKISDVIIQHHGNSMIGSFYEKARKDYKEEDKLSKDNFRYTGKKPQTKEAGIIMLADSVEAISRTMENISPSRLELMVKKTINKIYNDGQLDECELTLKDLNNIEKAFVKVLNSIFHQRIPYTERKIAEENANEKGENKYNELTKTTEDRPKVSPLHR